MAFKKTLAQRLFNIYRITNPYLTNCRITAASAAAKKPNPDKIAPDPGDNGIFRRFLHRQAISYLPSSAAGTFPKLRSLPIGEGLIERLRGMEIGQDRIRLDGLMPRPTTAADHRSEEAEEGMLTVEDAKKLLRLSQLEVVKEKLRQIEKNCVSYSEFLEICADGCGGNRGQGKEFGKMLDESGTVIVLGDVVFLRPQQVVRAIQGLIPVPNFIGNDPRLKELESMEKKKAAIDKKAESLVRRELWCGLGYFVIQTAAFMRLTFWELSWDVMEPICFYATSIYCMAGYTFFLRTSKEPSFEGFFQSRFAAKQKRLMKLCHFDLDRYNELRRSFYPNSMPPEPNSFSFASWSSSSDLDKVAVNKLE